MAYLIGTDEAGYGPNLGPLIVAATVWHISDELIGCDLYDVLCEAVTRKSSPSNGNDQIVVTDSKQLYQSRQGLNRLERALYPHLSLLHKNKRRWREIWNSLSPEIEIHRRGLAWYSDFDCDVPLDLNWFENERLQGILNEVYQKMSVRLVDLRIRPVFASEFNQLVNKYGNKSTVLTRVTLELLKKVTAPLTSEPQQIICDKHGGRNRYGHLLQQWFSDNLVEVRQEQRAESIYQWGHSTRRVEIRFTAKGESFLPTALASITAKYLRELAMLAFNDFWCRRLPGLRPTAGYPMDAKRFKQEIEPVQRQFGIDDDELWRCR